MNRAFEDLFGIANAFDGIQMAGRTDKWILSDAAARAGVDLSGGNFERFRHRYFVRLKEALPEPSLEKGVLPGVHDLLETIGARDDIFPGLLSGNCEQGARLKLEHFDLWKFFRCGAFGDEVTDRNHLFEVAVQSAEQSGWPRMPPHHVVIVGDTVLDVACARAHGARAVAVATGPSDLDTLRLSGADLVMRDLADVDAFLRFVFVQT